MQKDIAKNLKRIREEKHLTQAQVAKLLGYSLPGYQKIEQGARGLPIGKALKAAEIFGCTLNDLFLP